MVVRMNLDAALEITANIVTWVLDIKWDVISGTAVVFFYFGLVIIISALFERRLSEIFRVFLLVISFIFFVVLILTNMESTKIIFTKYLVPFLGLLIFASSLLLKRSLINEQGYFTFIVVLLSSIAMFYVGYLSWT